MEKVFLSHSSVDKSFVKYIADRFGKDHCVYDEMCFELGMKNLEEIFKGIDSTSIFVIFISDASLNSNWVMKELSLAEEKLHHDEAKLAQIFPIIIDENINHKDPRIPDFLKKGFDSYNLRVIGRKEIAYRKIRAQHINRMLKRDLAFSNRYDVFYGRDSEIQQFKRAFDSGFPIKCIVVAGIDGIGRKSYIIEALRDAQIIERYYEPVTITMDKLDGIDDLIIKLYEVGFGIYSIETITQLASMESKIDALSTAIKEVQEYHEHIIIYDNGCIVRNREIRYWFANALKQLRPEVTVSIASSFNLSYSFVKNNKEVFHLSLPSMSFPEWNGLLRIYSKSIGIEFNSEDREYFRDIITGYPPQVLYCADLAREYDSIEYVKKNSNKIVEYVSESVIRILENVLPDELMDVGYGFLSFLATYGSVPAELAENVFEINPQYEQVYMILRASTICRRVGSGGEYITVNSLVGDYIQRNKIDLPQDISELLRMKMAQFNENINDPNFVEAEDFESVRYYLKENIKAGQTIPSKYMYSTLYLKAIYELYNSQKYPQVVGMIKNLKEVGAFSRYDLPIQDSIQNYYCRALARQRDEEFYTEVEYFKRPIASSDYDLNYINYNFLRGFMFRNIGAYDKALERYKKVIAKNEKHRRTMREIVVVYKGMEDYESAYSYAQYNYTHEPENPYQIQPYFEALIRRSRRTKEEEEHLRNMLQTINMLNMRRPFDIYYELMAQYSMYIENDENQTRSFLLKGEELFMDSSFMARTAFDCYEHYGDIDNMEKSLAVLERESHNIKSLVPAFRVRRIILDAYQNRPERLVIDAIEELQGITDEAKGRLIKRLKHIKK